MLSDRQLQEAVQAELRWDPSVESAHIGVAASAGTVTLTGVVETYAEKRSAADAAHRVRGVLALAEEIVVQVPFERVRDDTAIAAAAIERLSWDTRVPERAVTVTVEQGWVTLAGKVAWFFQKQAAEHDIAGLQGVVGISNQVTVAPAVDVTGIGVAIGQALHRSWLFDNHNIAVAAEGGQVRLTGSVHTPAERQSAFAAAWSAPGVTSVVNDIVVT